MNTLKQNIKPLIKIGDISVLEMHKIQMSKQYIKHVYNKINNGIATTALGECRRVSGRDLDLVQIRETSKFNRDFLVQRERSLVEFS